MRHHRVDIDRAHPFLDRPLHTQQTDAVLIFHQLTNRTYTSVAEIINVINFTAAITQANDGPDHFDNVFLAQHTNRVFRIKVQTHIHLHATNSRQVITLRIEEQAMEKRVGRIKGRRFTWTHHTIDVVERLFTVSGLIDSQSVADEGTRVHMVDVQRIDFARTSVNESFEKLFRDFLTCFSKDLTRFQVNKLFSHITANNLSILNKKLLQTFFGKFAGKPRRQFSTCLNNNLATLRVDQIMLGLKAAIAIRIKRKFPPVFGLRVFHVAVERVENVLRVQTKRIEQSRNR